MRGILLRILVPRLLGLPPSAPRWGSSPMPQSGAGYDGAGGIDDALGLTGGGVDDLRANDGASALQDEKSGPELVDCHIGFPGEVGVGREGVAPLDVEQVHQHAGEPGTAGLLPEYCEHRTAPDLKSPIALRR